MIRKLFVHIFVEGLMQKLSKYYAILEYYTEKFPFMNLLWRFIWKVDLTIRLSQAFDNGKKQNA